MNKRVLIKGAGDLASGIGARLFMAGFEVMMTEIQKPLTVRRSVSFSSAVWDGEIIVEGIRGVKANTVEEAIHFALGKKGISILVDESAIIKERWKPDVVIDGIMAKKNINTKITDAPIVIALGPGFTAGKDCHSVIETMRGHDLGRVIYKGSAIPNTGIPGEVGGVSLQRLIKAPCDGTFQGLKKFGDMVKTGDIVAMIDQSAVCANTDGILRGLLADGIIVKKGLKVGDVDPRGTYEHCFTISDKARSLGGAALEAILHFNAINEEE